jgi:hypothetical protein
MYSVSDPITTARMTLFLILVTGSGQRLDALSYETKSFNWHGCSPLAFRLAVVPLKWSISLANDMPIRAFDGPVRFIFVAVVLTTNPQLTTAQSFSESAPYTSSAVWQPLALPCAAVVVLGSS